MADEPKGPGPMGDLMFVVGGLIVLVVLWYANGGPSRAKLNGLFLAPPAPLGNGESYGPQIGTSTQPHY